MSGSLKGITDGLRRLSEIKKDFSDLEFREENLILREVLLSAKAKILELEEHNSQLVRDLQKQAEKTTKQAELIEIEGFKYNKDGNTPIGIPYCPNCEVMEDGKLIPLIRVNDFVSKCPNCTNRFNAAKDGKVHAKGPEPTTIQVSIA